MDSLLSLLICSVLDFVDFKLVQEDLSSNRGAGCGWCLWPTFGLGTIHSQSPGSTNQPTNQPTLCLAWAQYTHSIPGQPTNQHGRVAQKMRDDKIIKLIYKRLPNCMKSDLKCMNNFDINNTDMMQFCKVLEHLKLSYQLEMKLEKTKKLEALKKDSEKHNGKCSGKKHANTTNESLPVSAKKPCLLHGTLSHATDKCEVMKEQAEKMKAMYNDRICTALHTYGHMVCPLSTL